jgi:hypothetical protein
MKQSLKPIVALLTFSIGVTLSRTDFYAVVLFSPLAVFFLFHVLLLGLVIHQLAVRENNRSQVIGKALLAVIVWVVPSLLVLLVSLGYMMNFSEDTKRNGSLWAVVAVGATSGCYGLVGAGLFRWVRNPRNEGLGMWAREQLRNH